MFDFEKKGELEVLRTWSIFAEKTILVLKTFSLFIFTSICVPMKKGIQKWLRLALKSFRRKNSMIRGIYQYSPKIG